MEVSGQHHILVALSPPYPLDRRLVESQGRFGNCGMEKIYLVPARNRTPVVQSVTRRYTDWATPVLHSTLYNLFSRDSVSEWAMEQNKIWRKFCWFRWTAGLILQEIALWPSGIHVDLCECLVTRKAVPSGSLSQRAFPFMQQWSSSASIPSANASGEECGWRYNPDIYPRGLTEATVNLRVTPSEFDPWINRISSKSCRVTSLDEFGDSSRLTRLLCYLVLLKLISFRNMRYLTFILGFIIQKFPGRI